MTPASRLRHLGLLLALLPQLLLLGLGRGVVLCIASDGHVQVELVSSACCLQDASAAGNEEPASGEDSDCGSCRDLLIAMEAVVSRNSVGSSIELPSNAIPLASPLASLESPPRADSSGTLPLAGSPRRALEPPHLSRLRSLQLRC